METVKSEVFKKILSEERNRLNSLFMMSRQMKLEPEVFLSKVSDIIDPVMLKSGMDYGQKKKIAIILYEKILELCTKDILGSEGKYPGFERSLKILIENFPELVAGETSGFISSVSNGVLNMIKFNPDMTDEWTDRISGMKQRIKTLDDFQKTGFIIAWTTGMSCYRDKSIELLHAMDDASVIEFLSLPFSLDENRESFFNAMASNPWLDPKKYLSHKNEILIIQQAGKFSGYGGVFSYPPETFVSDGKIIASDGDRFFILFADSFGIMLVAANDADITMNNPVKKNDIELDDGWNAVKRDKKFCIPENFRLPVSSKSSCSQTLCYTSGISHCLFVVGIGASNNGH
jgi:hypothetical protein